MRCRTALIFDWKQPKVFHCRYKHEHEGEHSARVRGILYEDRPGPDEICWDEKQFTLYAKNRNNINGDGSFLVPKYVLSSKSVQSVSVNGLRWNCSGSLINRTKEFVTEGGVIKQRIDSFCEDHGIRWKQKIKSGKG